jgi:hypothetical protein
MGKQVAVAMLEEVEVEFLAFLRSTADVRVFRHAAPTAAALAVENFSHEGAPCWQFYVWNTAFRWEHSVAYVSSDTRVVDRRGWAYINNSHDAPVLEYDRYSPTHGGGRIYWSKFFCAPAGLSYDVVEFERWYERVARWIRKRGHRSKAEKYGRYYMPKAWSIRGAAL